MTVTEDNWTPSLIYNNLYNYSTQFPLGNCLSIEFERLIRFLPR